MFDLGAYNLKFWNKYYISQEECFTDAYVEKVFKSEFFCTHTNQLHTILEDKYDKEELNKSMKEKLQHLMEY